MMMLEKNIDYVAYAPSVDTSWVFTVKGRAVKLSESLNELFFVIGKMYDISSGLFIPTKIEYGLQSFARDGPVNMYFQHNIRKYGYDLGRVGIVNNVLESEKGVSYQDLRNNIEGIVTPPDTTRYIVKVCFCKGKTKFVLKDRDEYIDHTSKGLYMMVDEDGSIIEPSIDPLYIEILQGGLKGPGGSVDVDDPAYYLLDFKTETDIWFEDTEIGWRNQDRLKNLFQKIKDNFEVVETDYYGNAEALFD